MKCEKAGCDQPAFMHVTLEAADDCDMWDACREHAETFRQWVIEQVEFHGDDLAYLRMERYGEYQLSLDEPASAE